MKLTPLFALLVGLTMAAPAVAQVRENVTLQPSRLPGMCVTMTGPEGEALSQPCANLPEQVFEFPDEEGGPIRQAGQCLTPQGEGPYPRLVALACDASPEQTWRMSERGELRSSAGRCLSVLGASSRTGETIYAAACPRDYEGQLWRARDLVSRHVVEASLESLAHPGLCIGYSPSLALYPCTDAYQQVMSFDQRNTSQIRMMSSCLSGGFVFGALRLTECWEIPEQQWMVDDKGRIANDNNECIEVSNEDGVDVLRTRVCTDAPEQLWRVRYAPGFGPPPAPEPEAEPEAEPAAEPAPADAAPEPAAEVDPAASEPELAPSDPVAVAEADLSEAPAETVVPADADFSEATDPNTDTDFNVASADSVAADPAPDEPVTAPDEPVTAPDVPVIASDVPVIASDEPVTAPDEPVTAPDEPVTAPDVPVTASDEPVTAPDEPVTAPDEPVTAPDEPVIAPDEPVIASAEPEPAPYEPETPAADIAPTTDTPLADAGAPEPSAEPAAADTSLALAAPAFTAPSTLQHARLPGMCVSMTGPDGQSESQPCSGSAEQQFVLPVSEAGPIRHADKCLSPRGQGLYPQLRADACDGSPEQTWFVTTDGEIRSMAGQCLSLLGVSSRAGERVYAGECPVNYPVHHWQVVPAEAEAPRPITTMIEFAARPGRCLGHDGALGLVDCNVRLGRIFSFDAAAPSQFRAMSGCLAGGFVLEGLALGQCWNIPAQKWSLTLDGQIVNDEGKCIVVMRDNERDVLRTGTCAVTPDQQWVLKPLAS